METIQKEIIFAVLMITLGVVIVALLGVLDTLKHLVH